MYLCSNTITQKPHLVILGPTGENEWKWKLQGTLFGSCWEDIMGVWTLEEQCASTGGQEKTQSSKGW